MVEGGGHLHGAFVDAGHWDRMFLYQAPRILGEGRPVFAGVGWDTVEQSPQVRVVKRRTFGVDLLTIIEPVR